MIVVSCPSCATRFKMDKSLIPDKGRIVRCSACQHKWRLVLPPSMQSGSAAQPEVPLRALYNMPNAPTPPSNYDDTEAKNKKGNLRTRLYIPFIIVLFIWAISFLTLFLYPSHVVKYIPEMRGLYDAIGMKIERTGISLIQPFLEIRNDPDANSNTLIIRGTVMNTHAHDVLEIRPIKVSLRDKANFIVQEFLITEFTTPSLAPGGIEDFTYEVPNLPSSVIDVEITLTEE